MICLKYFGSILTITSICFQICEDYGKEHLSHGKYVILKDMLVQIRTCSPNSLLELSKIFDE